MADHDPDNCPNLIRMQLLLDQVRHNGERLDNAPTKSELNGAIAEIRGVLKQYVEEMSNANRKIEKDNEETKELVNKLSLKFDSAKGAISFLKWIAGIIATTAALWSAIHGLMIQR